MKFDSIIRDLGTTLALDSTYQLCVCIYNIIVHVIPRDMQVQSAAFLISYAACLCRRQVGGGGGGL